MSHCRLCPNRGHRAACPSESQDCAAPTLVLIGEAPGFTELHEGRPFSPRGASGRLLAETMRQLKLPRSACWIGNAVNCDARGKRDLEKAQPVCAPRLIEELADLDPSAVLVPLGSAALRSLLGKRAASILKFRGSVTKLTEGPLAGRFMVPSVHPAFALRRPAYCEVLRRDLARALDIQRHGWESPEAACPMHVVRELGELEARLSELGEETALDVETTFDPPLWNKLICFSLSDAKSTIVVPWSATRGGDGCIWEKPQHAAGLVTACLAERLCVTHNGPSFDHIVAERYGIKVSAVADTLIAFHALHGELPKNLGFAASFYVPVPPWKTYNDKTADLPRLYSYNAKDACYTALAWGAIKQEMALAA